jgi:tyrosine-protein kinase Etk/Wzc
MVTTPPSLFDAFVRAPVVRKPLWRRIIFGIMIAVFVVLTLFPEKHRAAVTLTPTDPGSLGLASALTQLGAVQNVFGQQTAVEVSILIGRSEDVRARVIEQLNLTNRLRLSQVKAMRWLDDNVDLRALRGGIIQVEVENQDADLAYDIVNAYAGAIRSQLGAVSREQTAYKRGVLQELVDEASNRLADAQARYDTFRLRTRYSSPEGSIRAIGDRVPELESMIIGKQTELNAAREFFTEDHLTVRQIRAEIDALQRQLNEARSLAPSDSNSVGRVVRESTEVDRLRRELDLSLSLYEGYKRVLEGTSVEELTSSANIRILESAYIDSNRQYNLVFAILAVATALLALGIEFYTWRQPVGVAGRRGEPILPAAEAEQA